jgi:methionine synthase II (cobalamin-independent)
MVIVIVGFNDAESGSGLLSHAGARQDELESRIREASRFVPLERLAVSPQCGFSSSVIGNAITPADQERKLSLVVETARRVWGEDAPLRSSS